MSEPMVTPSHPTPVIPTARVLCRDPRLCRFLEIELATLGIVAVAGDATPGQEPPCLCMVDGDDPRWRASSRAPAHLAARWGCPVLVFGRGIEKIDGSDSRVTYLRRPFSLIDLEETLRRLTAPAAGGGVRLIPRPLADRSPAVPSEVEMAAETVPAPDETPPPLITVRDGVVTIDGRRVPLTPAEWLLFSCLYSHPGETVPREELAALLSGGGNSVEVYIHHLRDKLEKPLRRRLIHAVRGKGYRWEA